MIDHGKHDTEATLLALHEGAQALINASGGFNNLSLLVRKCLPVFN